MPIDKHHNLPYSFTVDKKCTCCGEVKTIEQFYRRNESWGDGHQSQCKKCLLAKTHFRSKRIKAESKILIKDRICPKCGMIKTADNFHKNATDKSGYATYCKECVRLSQIEYYRKLGKSLSIPSEKKCAVCGEVKPSDQFSKTGRSKDGLNRRCKACNSEASLKYYYKNKKDQNKKHVKRAVKKMSEDLGAKLSHRLRSRILNAITRQYATKAFLSAELLGCSIGDCRKHLESKFKDGMTWENYGLHGWHIDHIKPCASFDLTTQEEQKKCFHYSNLQPLWAEENLSKGARIDIK